jgi:hypothetical protein
MAWYGTGGIADVIHRAAFDTFSDTITLTKSDGSTFQNFALDWHSERFTSLGEITEQVGDLDTDQWGEVLRSDGYKVGDFPPTTGSPRHFGFIQLSGRTFTIRGVSSSQSHIRLHCDQGRDDA